MKGHFSLRYAVHDQSCNRYACRYEPGDLKHDPVMECKCCALGEDLATQPTRSSPDLRILSNICQTQVVLPGY